MTSQSGGRFDEFPTPPQGTRMPVSQPPNGGTRTRTIAVLAGVAGLVAGAAVASGAWLLFGNEGGSSAAVDAPERLGDYYRFDKAPDPGSEGRHKKVVDRFARYDKESTSRLSSAHDGAGALVQRYTTEDFDSMFSLEVVRVASPFPPYVPFTDPEDLGVDKPPEEILRYGAVACAVRNSPNQSPIVLTCLRTGDDLSVSVSRVNGDVGEKPEEVAKLVDEAWSKLR